MRSLLILLTLVVSLFATQSGELSFYLMKDGKPLSNQIVIIFKKDNLANMNHSGNYNKHSELLTDEDGYIFSVLAIGTYQLQVVAKEGNLPQAYVKKNFIISNDEESQIIVSLKSDNTVAFTDDEAPKIDKDKEKSIVKQAKVDNGFIQLTLSSSEDKKVVKGARVFVKGLSVDIKSDAKGSVKIKAPIGEQIISIIHSDFSSQTLKVNILANKTVTKLVELSPASMELDEFIVLAPQVEGSVASLVAEKKNSSVIADILGSEQMSKKGDSNVATALKRVSGVTLVDGKNVYIRGLGERYSNIELNSMPLPSPDPYKRVVPLNIFPTSVIGSLKVQKTYSADLPGNFAGGYINLRTKEEVSEDYIKVSLTAKAHSSALNSSKGNYYKGGSDDIFGKDDGTRSIPTSILKNGNVVIGERPPRFNPYGTDLSQEDIINMTKDIAKRPIDTHKKSVPFGGKVGVELGKRVELDSDNVISVLANYSYDQSHKNIIEEFFGYSIDGSGNISNEADTFGENHRTSSNYKQNAMLNVAYNSADIFKLKYTLLYVHDTVESTRITEGVMGSNNDLQRLYSLEWEEKTLLANQINGSLEHELFVPLHLNFGAQISTANLNQPNNVKYEYIDYTDSGDNFEVKTQSAQNFINHNLTTNDELSSLYLNEVADVNIFSDQDKIEFGITFVDKVRKSESNKYFLKAQKATNISVEDSLSSPDTIFDKYIDNDNSDYYKQTFLVQPIFSPSDYYDADLKEKGLYLKTLLNPSENYEISIGFRKADLKQILHEYTVNPSNGKVVINDNALVINKILPNIDMRYKFSDNDQLRFGYSETYIYPDFREFSSSGYFHPTEAATVIGNPNLTQTDVTNYDLRFEHYFSATEGWSAALFYKQLDNPIEDVSRPTTSLPIYSYENTESAIVYGAELEISKNLDFIDSTLEYLYASTNFTYTSSDVTLSEKQQDEFTNNHRKLQGLSPIVVNANLGYDDTNGRMINLSYNYMSERIRKVGLKNGVQEYQDQFEIPPHVVDFTWQERLKENMDMQLKVRNLLNGEIEWVEGSNITKRYKLGRKFEVKLSYKY